MMTTNKSLLEYELLNSHSGIFAFSTTRHGGCSRGSYASLNCTPYTGDNPEHVAANCRLLKCLLPHPNVQLIIPYQTHGTEILEVDSHFVQATEEERHERLQGIDALITRQPGCCLCISTADCIPVLLYDHRHRAIAAVHAGWRGTVKGIVTQTLREMHTRYGTQGCDVTAAIGPGISLPAFEVGDEVYEAFRTKGFPMDCIAQWHPESHKWHIDLWAANRLQLDDFGISAARVQTAGICTYAQCQDFFSARRLGIRSGRMLSGIMMQPE